jgi:hypothetical protein
MSVERGTAGTGAVLSLSAIGKQDTFLSDLSGDPNNSFWTYKPLQHSNFTLYYRNIPKSNPNGTNWPFDQTIKFDIDPKSSGDALANCFLKLTLPGLTGGEQYCDQIGRALIKEFSFRVGDTVIQTVPGDWGILHDELYSDETEKKAHRSMFNAGQPEGTLPTSGVSVKPIPIYLPLNFFFSRFNTALPGNWTNNDAVSAELENTSNFKSYFMMCACTQQTVTVSVTFNPITFFSNTTSLSLTSVNLVLEEVSLTPEEVLYYRNTKQTFIYNTVIKQPQLRLDKGDGVKNASGPIPPGCHDTFKNHLTANIPVKAFHWFLRDQRYEDVTDVTYFLNRFNFCRVQDTPPQQEFKYNTMAEASLYLNGNKQLGFFSQRPPFTDVAGASYYKYVQSYIHRYNAPERNIYTYSFSLNPRDPAPSGSLDFSVMNTSKTVLEGHIHPDATSNSYNVNMFYLGYIVLSYQHDFCHLTFL